MWIAAESRCRNAYGMSDLEAQSRLRSIRDVLEHEGHVLSGLGDPRLDAVLRAIEELEAAIVVALGMYDQPPVNGDWTRRASNRIRTNR